MSHSRIGLQLKSATPIENANSLATETKIEEQGNQLANNYSGYIGLNTETDNFNDYVMRCDEIIKLFANGQKYQAPFVYPKLPADGFQKPVIFAAENITGDDGFNLLATITTNKKPKSWMGWLASLMLPSAYIMKDHIEFFTDMQKGFGAGAFQITSVDCRTPNGEEAPLTKAMLAVTDRPGLFLKVKTSADEFYNDVAIFFPDKVSGCTHKPVQYGEAFVLIPEGNLLSAELIENISNTFNKLVKKSYGKDEGLFFVSPDSESNNIPIPKP
ncbi:MAG: hypothetical protein P4M12_04565 [Gammaproteobacteria bacterium]|nr:hypothetical protein [Gammaproteobacteria bacterium]